MVTKLKWLRRFHKLVMLKPKTGIRITSTKAGNILQKIINMPAENMHAVEFESTVLLNLIDTYLNVSNSVAKWTTAHATENRVGFYYLSTKNKWRI